jgi:uncharacterized membrane protein
MGAIIVLRIVHIFFGVFWAGAVMFLNLLVGPSITAAGPDGFKVMRELNKRRFMHAILGSGAFNILSGLDLMRRDSANFSSGWFHSPMGMGLSTGMLAAIIAFLIGLLAINPAMKRLGALSGQMMAAPPEARPAMVPQVEAARARLIAFGKVGMLFLVIAVLAMATARYL